MVAGGIYQKLERDVDTLQGGTGDRQPFWVYYYVRDNIPLRVEHFAPSFCLIGFGLIPSIIVFLVEVRHGLHKRSVVNKAPSRSIRRAWTSNTGQRISTNPSVSDSDSKKSSEKITEIQTESTLPQVQI